ncbi:MAG: tRNA 4-thiouridine(8) synthase ThiI [Lactobacillales bacterium]|nr:tRNA 4-thiouridine(8) synthase ThiI [Lactobacillales bacterium]
MDRLIMIKYGELTTKKANRKMFINMLENNINKILKNEKYEISKDRVRMYIKCDSSSLDSIVKKLKKVFGIHGIVIADKVNTNIDSIKEKVLEKLDDNYKTFKVNTKRADKKFEIHSMDFNRVIGGHVLKNTNLKVDVHNPDVLINIEIRPEGTFIYTNEIKGLGGYPVGIQGKGLLMLSGGIDSPVAGYLSLKRGVDLECLYFESPPHTSVEAKNKVLKLASIINEYSGNIKVNIVPFTKIQEEIYKNCPDSYIITIMRRMMYRIAEEVSRRKNLKVIINGESIGQVASQTLTSMIVINNVTNMPVIRPVSCMDKLEIIDIATKIGTYETSILPYEDCCTIFLPKHPVINPDLAKAILYENSFDYQTLINECIENIEVISNFEEDNFENYL